MGRLRATAAAVSTLAAVALAAGAVTGAADPGVAGAHVTLEAVSPARVASPAEVAHGRAALGRLRVADDVLVGDGSGYDRRARFGGWRSTGRGCDERDVVLASELTAVRYTPGSSCNVAGGLLDGDPVDGDDVDIDHVVPLRRAWSSGAAGWTDEQRRAFANDRANLRVERSAGNRSDGDEGPEQSPPAPVGDLAARCRYGVAYATVADHYGLTVTGPRLGALRELVDECGPA